LFVAVWVERERCGHCKLLYVTGGPDEPPYGQCIAWCRDGKCKKTDATISFDCARYEHKDEHKGKFPDAHMPQRSRTS